MLGYMNRNARRAVIADTYRSSVRHMAGWTGAMAALALLLAVPVQARPGGDRGRGDEGIGGRPAGAVYTMTNAVNGNTILSFHRTRDGHLVSDGTYPTGGLGTGGGLGNQAGLVLSESRRWLLAVDAGSDQVSLFRVQPNSLRRTDVAASGGDMPISIALHDNLVYVLNAGTPANISGFFITARGQLVPLPGSTRALSTPNPGPAQVGFSPDGDVLVVTEKATNVVDTFEVNDDGYAGNIQTFVAPGVTPFGFAFDSDGHLFVTEAFPGILNASATTAYDVSSTGALSVISPSVGTNQSSACWAVVTPDSRFLYVTDAASGVISGYGIAEDGAISLLDPSGVAAATGAGSTPIDMALSRDGRFLYVLQGGTSAIGAYSIGPDGALTSISTVSGLPGSRNGLAAW